MPLQTKLRIFIFGFMTLSASCTKPAKSGDQGGSKKISYFVSIDGLQPDLLLTLKNEGRLKAPLGLGWLLEDSMVSREASPVVTSLTASSHASTITCTPPSRHGIYANGFIKDGKKVNGFNEPLNTEPFWRSSMRQGKKVLSLGYVGTDGSDESRKASFGLAYPLDSLLGPSQTLNWTLQDLAPASGWTLPPELTAKKDLREATIAFTLNPKTQEKRLVEVLLAPTPEGTATLYFGKTKDLLGQSLGKLASNDPTHPIENFFFVEEDSKSALKGSKRRVFARALAAPAGKINLYLSRVSYNQAYPESFRQALDDQNMVWPDYGIKDPSVTLGEWVEVQAMIDQFLVDVATKTVPEQDIDIVLFYQPLIDALGHKMQGKLPQPFKSTHADEVTQAFVRSFELVDQNLSRLFSIPGSDGAKFVMGDHGMDPVHTVINIAPLLPKDHVDKVEVLTSGDLVLIYPLQSPGDKEAAWNAAYEVGEALKQKLTQTMVKGQSTLGFARKRTDFTTTKSDDYLREWQFGEAAWAFAAPSGLWLQYQPLKQELLLDVPAYGMHGKSVGTTDMVTMFIGKGLGAPAKELGPMSLIQAIPTFSKLLGIAPPKDCVGTSLVP